YSSLISSFRIVCLSNVLETNNHRLLAETLAATTDSVLPTRGIPRIPINLCPSFLNSSAIKSTKIPKSSLTKRNVFRLSASLWIYRPCLTASLSRNFGLRIFLISIVSIVCIMDLSLVISSSLDSSSIPRLAAATPLIDMMLMESIPKREEMSPNKPGRLYCNSYSRYHSVFSIANPFNRHTDLKSLYSFKKENNNKEIRRVIITGLFNILYYYNKVFYE